MSLQLRRLWFLMGSVVVGMPLGLHESKLSLCTAFYIV